MRNLKTILCILGVVGSGLGVVPITAAQRDFSGVWVLDKAKTRSVPRELTSYTMTVTQDAQQLVVETQEEGALAAVTTGGSMGGGYISQGAMPGGFKVGALALSIINPRIAYPLDGQDRVEPLRGLMNATVRIKAKWSKDQKTLDLSYVQTLGTPGQTSTLTLKDRWTISEDGEVLKVQRNVATGAGGDAMTLFLRKAQGKTPTPQQ